MARRATLAILLVALVPLAAVAGVVYLQQRTALIDDGLARLDAVAASRATQIESFLREAREDHLLLVTRSRLQAAVVDHHASPDGTARATLEALLRDARETEPDIVALHLLDGAGRRIASTHPDAPLDALPAASGEPPAITFRLSPSGTLENLVTGPVVVGEQTLATLVAVRAPRDLLAIGQDHTGLGTTGETVIAYPAPDGSRFVTPRRFAADELLAPVPTDEDWPIAMALRAREGTSTELVDYRGARVFAATRHVDEPAWGIVVKMDRAEMLAPVDRLARSLLLGLLAAASVVSVVALLIGAAIRSAERQLRRSGERLARLLDAAPVGVVFCDGTGSLEFANPRAEDLLDGHGVPAGDELDAPWQEVELDGTPVPAGEATVATVLGSGVPAEGVRRRVLRPDGVAVPVSVDAAPLRDEDGTVRGVVAILSDISAELVAAEVQARLASIVESADDAILSLDRDGVVRSWNDGAERTFGLRQDEVVGRPITVIVPDDRLAELAELHAQVHEGRSVRNLETVRVHRDGYRLPVALTLSPVRDGHGRVVGLSAVERDITEQVRDRERLQRYASELEQFAYVAAHDLQEPLRMVASFTELLARRYRGQLDADADEFIGFAVDGARRIQRALNELLAYVTANTGAPFAPVDSARLVQAALSALRIELHRSHAEVEVGELPTVVADETQLLRVFQNLLDNALKFSDGPPRVRVTAERSNGEWMFAVADEGIGIAPEHLDRLFGLFRRLHNRIEYPGTGLGLAICKKIIERHDGRIWIDSEPGHGTTVRFTLPARQEIHHG